MRSPNLSHNQRSKTSDAGCSIWCKSQYACVHSRLMPWAEEVDLSPISVYVHDQSNACSLRGLCSERRCCPKTVNLTLPKSTYLSYNTWRSEDWRDEACQFTPPNLPALTSPPKTKKWIIKKKLPTTGTFSQICFEISKIIFPSGRKLALPIWEVVPSREVKISPIALQIVIPVFASLNILLHPLCLSVYATLRPQGPPYLLVLSQSHRPASL